MSTAAWLRLENAAIAILAGVLFGASGESLWWAALWLTPDLAMVGYLAGSKVGSQIYNAAHSYAAPVALGAGGLLLGAPLAASLALLWANHIGVDRALGYGLKHATDFKDTHLGRIGRG
ncbi:DUF4260 family protein [Rubricoccus marinus]|uniref:DUF4260 domain-containing protein n=1 Tax=Rubricoccus marinus TaxID=716817 RepID=A0A259TWQ8_9BACT|nr:DUF4260 family protein [Rubricoccus marinus]OZC02130.1 hypothetical protein BSZ36_03495 [Rubricoccus marinus]